MICFRSHEPNNPETFLEQLCPALKLNSTWKRRNLLITKFHYGSFCHEVANTQIIRKPPSPQTAKALMFPIHPLIKFVYNRITTAKIKTFDVIVHRSTSAQRWQTCTRAWRRRIGGWSSQVFRCWCTIRARRRVGVHRVLLLFWPNAEHASLCGKIRSTIYPIIKSPVPLSIRCASRVVRYFAIRIFRE